MTLPLKDVRILDLTTSYSGPIGTMQLADFGADVIKVEHYKKGDFSRGWTPMLNGKSLFFPTNNRNKRSVTLNLKSEEGKKIFLEMVKHADVVVENFRGGTMERMGLSYETVSKANPKIIMASLSGFGQTGPLKNEGCYSNLAEATAGTMFMTGFPDMPIGSGTSFGDSMPGVFTALGIMIALYHREKTGEGQFIDVSMVDVLVAMLEGAITTTDITGQNPERDGNRDGALYPYDTFQAKDGYCFLTETDIYDWTDFAKACEIEDLIDDPRFATNTDRVKNADELFVYINEWTKKHTNEEIREICSKYSGISYASINSISDVIKNEHINARNMIVDVFDKELGRSYKMPGIPIKMSKTPGEIRHAAPGMGEHNAEVYKELGYTEEDLAELKERNII